MMLMNFIVKQSCSQQLNLYSPRVNCSKNVNDEQGGKKVWLLSAGIGPAGRVLWTLALHTCTHCVISIIMCSYCRHYVHGRANCN